jgi:hypothetical protein
MALADLSREQLLALVDVYAKNWLAHDGCWFLAAEERFGLETAIALDTAAWACFAPIEARRIVQAFDLPASGGLATLERALGLRLYSAVNRQESEWVDAETLRFRMCECRVQQARRRKGLAPFPCKPVGLVEYTGFARAIDARITTRCLQAPPDPVTDRYCEWEFRLAPGDSV